jgi:hypothetical protein
LLAASVMCEDAATSPADDAKEAWRMMIDAALKG